MDFKKRMHKKAIELSRLLSSISTPSRLMIVCMLIDGEKNVSDIVSKIGTTKGNISQHLRVMISNNVLESRREGNKIFYCIKDKKIVNLINTIKKLYCPDFKI